jgi:hypothetical protein
LSAVVIQELAAGARTSEAVREVQQGVFEPFERRRRVFAPSTAAFVESGRIIAAVAKPEGWQLIDENPSLLNDALIAVSVYRPPAKRGWARSQRPRPSSRPALP